MQQNLIAIIDSSGRFYERERERERTSLGNIEREEDKSSAGAIKLKKCV